MFFARYPWRAFEVTAKCDKGREEGGEALVMSRRTATTPVGFETRFYSWAFTSEG